VPAVTSSPTTADGEKTDGEKTLDPSDTARVDSLARAFAAVPDPRSPRGRWHPLPAILLIAACAVTCDANGFTAIRQWAEDAPQEVLVRLGVRVDPLTGLAKPPSERTIRRTIARLDAGAVEKAAGTFVASKLRAAGLGPNTRTPARRRPPGRQDRTRRPSRRQRKRRRIAFDGKVLRGARRLDGTRVTLLAGADHDTATVVSQHEIDAKTNETPELRTQIAGLDLTGCLVTADAAHCQKATAEQIITAGGHYLLTLKANQASLLTAVAGLLDGTDAEWADRSHHSTGRGHGRTEQRTVRLTTATGIDFPHAAQVFRTVRHRGGLDGQRTSKQVVYGITSLPPDAAGPAEIAADQRGHWTIENRTHHVRDTTFDEDRSQIRTGNSPRTMAALRNLAIDTFRAHGHTNIAHARRHHTHDYDRVLTLYGL
jgi:predicted transposase YbfD/YdcC